MKPYTTNHTHYLGIQKLTALRVLPSNEGVITHYFVRFGVTGSCSILLKAPPPKKKMPKGLPHPLGLGEARGIVDGDIQEPSGTRKYLLGGPGHLVSGL